ncbi:hypothetical protein M501DRAFT_1000840 [Patellaria atrata CBS 101060]|uniref:Pre-rRNA-processing protein RIX1 n=1 Tax=Patellaria atrata CBS 101060 TaxID=1346257 RepID=A0A9P4SH99_9PEZI|nr:hypothetical protein M501DRAFT_1000840 [Patellaria atrata CBS 101060]
MTSEGYRSASAALRSLTFRISSVPIERLPSLVPYLCATLTSCRAVLSSPQTAQLSGSKESLETAVTIHKFKTQVSSLLQDRTVDGRWVAVVLVKCTVELGGWEVLQDCGSWVRSLLNILSKHGPPSTKKLCIITLTRIFVLTRDYPTLTREITTPSLPAYIASCLNNLSPSAKQSPTNGKLLDAVLECFNCLIPRHPTIFRTYVGQIRSIISSYIAPTPSNALNKGHTFPDHQNQYASRSTRHHAQRVWVQLHHCAPKSASAVDWEEALKTTIQSIHSTADQIFRAVIEDWESVASVVSTIQSGQTRDHIPSETDTNPIGLPSWSGIWAGAERISGLIELLREFIITSNSPSIILRVGLIMDLFNRIFSLTVPQGRSSDQLQVSVRLNTQIEKDERESMWLILPGIHTVTVKVVSALIERMEISLLPLAQILLDQLIWVFDAEEQDADLRSSIYHATSQLLNLIGPCLSKETVTSLRTIIRACCRDLDVEIQQADQKQTSNAQEKGFGSKASTNADAFLPNINPTTPRPAINNTTLRASAERLLPVLLSKLPTTYVTVPLRSQMDRIAVMSQHKDAMVASVLKPPKKVGHGGQSILPLLARSFPESSEVEAILRPRFPPIRVAFDTNDGSLEEEDQEDKKMDDVEQISEAVNDRVDTLAEHRINQANADIKPMPPYTPGPSINEPVNTSHVENPASENVSNTNGSILPKSSPVPSETLWPKRPSMANESLPENNSSVPAPPAASTEPTTNLPSFPSNDSSSAAREKMVSPRARSSQQVEFSNLEGPEGDSEEEDEVPALVLGSDSDDDSDE